MKVRYDSNNSGGRWWLTDEDWAALEAAGWEVKWQKDQDRVGLGAFVSDDGRWLGALATEATIETVSVAEAIANWKATTGKDPDEKGCSCCGQPHDFYEE